MTGFLAKFSTDALCAQTDPDSFFPERGGSVTEAKKVCLACPIRVQCLEWALNNGEDFGVWGGLSERERHKLRRTDKRPAPPPASRPHTGGKALAPCGTRAAYERHLRRKEPVDDACREANNAANVAKRDRQRELRAQRRPAA